MTQYNPYLDPNCPNCTCADWGAMFCLSTCEREIYIKRKMKEMSEQNQLTEGNPMVGVTETEFKAYHSDDQVELVGKAKVRRLNMGQRFQVMELLKNNQAKIAEMSSNKDVADFVMRECKVEMSAQTAANYLKELGIPSPGSSGDPILKAKVALLEQKVEGLTDKITEILQYIERQASINDQTIEALSKLKDKINGSQG